MKPRSKSVWITPAACGALYPLRMTHARTCPAHAAPNITRTHAHARARARASA